jgi:predicted transglutaminase-like cysteine proteinase
MKRNILGAALLMLGMVAATAAEAEIKSLTLGQDASSPFMRIFGRSLPPIGHVGFCQQNPADCERQGPKRVKMELTQERKDDLRTVNDLVNRMIRPVSDMRLYGRIEHWTYPTGKGDCEDYVLLKQRLLIERGWPASSLLITVVRDENNEGHAILTARTSRGEYLLDNKQSKIMTWNDSLYSFVKRQSGRDPKVWVSLTRPGQRLINRTAGTRTNQIQAPAHQ